jgi:anti-sigma regulatory factor (Ser/Thr protein kinase)
MAGDRPAASPAGPDGSSGQAQVVLAGIEGVAVPTLDQAFDSGTLPRLRAGVRAHARQAGLPDGRVGDVVLAVHELAANAICHGAGAGRLRMWAVAGALHCQVDDAGPVASRGPDEQPDGAAAEPAGASGQTLTDPWHPLPGHGLWVVQQVADQLRVLSGPRGTSAAITFAMPSRSLFSRSLFKPEPVGGPPR